MARGHVPCPRRPVGSHSCMHLTPQASMPHSPLGHTPLQARALHVEATLFPFKAALSLSISSLRPRSPPLSAPSSPSLDTTAPGQLLLPPGIGGLGAPSEPPPTADQAADGGWVGRCPVPRLMTLPAPVGRTSAAKVQGPGRAPTRHSRVRVQAPPTGGGVGAQCPLKAALPHATALPYRRYPCHTRVAALPLVAATECPYTGVVPPLP